MNPLNLLELNCLRESLGLSVLRPDTLTREALRETEQALRRESLRFAEFDRSDPPPHAD